MNRRQFLKSSGSAIALLASGAGAPVRKAYAAIDTSQPEKQVLVRIVDKRGTGFLIKKFSEATNQFEILMTTDYRKELSGWTWKLPEITAEGHPAND